MIVECVLVRLVENVVNLHLKSSYRSVTVMYWMLSRDRGRNCAGWNETDWKEAMDGVCKESAS